MKLEVGKEYMDSGGNIIDIISVNFKCPHETLAVGVYKNLGNTPSVFPLDGFSVMMGHYMCNAIIGCVGICQLPIFRKVKNRKGQNIDFLVNYVSENNMHIGIIYTNDYGMNLNDIGTYSVDGEIEFPMYEGEEYKESINF